MKLHIKYMVSNRCKVAVKEELSKHGLHFVIVDLGEVDVMEELTTEQLVPIGEGLHHLGFELMEDKKAVLIEKIKTTIIQMVHHSDDLLRINLSDYLSEKTRQPYPYLAKLFSEVQGITIEQFMIRHKLERIKELIIYGELNMTEIAYKMNYSSVAHLSNQFKKGTGFSPSYFKKLKDRRRNPIEEI